MKKDKMTIVVEKKKPLIAPDPFGREHLYYASVKGTSDKAVGDSGFDAVQTLLSSLKQRGDL